MDYWQFLFRVRQAISLKPANWFERKRARPYIAKIERSEAIENLDEIIHVSDAIMVARGDLGVELAMQLLPGVQKSIIHKTRNQNKAVITRRR